jgi:integrase
VRTKTGAPPAHRDIDVTDSESVRRRQSSANRSLTTLKAALNYCFSEKLAASDAEWRRVKPFKNVESARVRYLQVAEAKRFINACNPVFRPLAQAALQTGCRYGELTRLKVGDFNADSGTLAIWQSKSGKSRHVVLTTEGAAFFTELCAGRAAGELMLLRANGGSWRKSNQAEFMVSACHARQDRATDQLSCAAPHLGKFGDHERNAAAGCRAQFGPPRHQNGRGTLRPSVG